MPLEPREGEVPVDVVLGSPRDELPIVVIFRMLGEYSAKVSLGLQLPIGGHRATATTSSREIITSRVREIVFALACALMFCVVIVIEVYGGRAPLSELWIPATICVVSIVFSLLRVFSIWNELKGRYRRPELELAVWQLRRVYQVASRMEDLGRDMDFARQLEFELRLSEAQFLLNRAEKLGITEATADAEIAGVLRARSKRSGDEQPSAAPSERPSQTPSVMKMAESP